MRFKEPDKYELCGTGFKNCKTGDCKEPDYIDADIFTPIVKTGFRKFRKAKSLNQIIWVKQIMNLMAVKLTVSYFALLEKIQILLI